MTRSFWDKRAEQYDRAVGKHDAAYRQTVAATRAVLTDADVVLDYGCATGEFSLDIASRVQRVHGIDISPKMIALATQKARGRGVYNVRFDATDLFDPSLDNDRYTCILAFSVLHLVDDVHSALQRANELLPRGGLFISETPCFGEKGPLFRLLLGIAQLLKVAPPLLSFTAVTLEAEVADAGFDITESKEWDAKTAVQWITARKR